MKYITLLLLLLLPAAVAYDYCETRNIYPTGSCSCSGAGSCSVNCRFVPFTVNKTVYNVYFEDTTSGVGGGTGTYAPVTNFAAYFAKTGTSASEWYKGFSQKVASFSYAGSNAEEGVIPFSKNFINLTFTISLPSGYYDTVSISNSYITYICYDYYPVSVVVTDGTNPIQNANVSYYYYTSGSYYFIENKQTDASGSVVLEACYNCIFKIQVNATGFGPIEKVITVTTNTYTINLRYEFEGFNSLWESVFWRLDPDYQYLPQQAQNQTLNLTVYSSNNTLEWFSLNITSINTGQRLYFRNISSASGGIINGTFNSTFSNVTLVKVKIKAVGYDEVEITRVYYSYKTNTTYDYLTLDGMFRFLSNQTVSIEGMSTENSTKLFFGLLISVFMLAATLFVGINMGTYAVFGASLVGLILLIVFASYGMISWGIVVLTGFLIIGLSLIFSGVI